MTTSDSQPDPSSKEWNVNAANSQGSIIGDYTHVTQHFYQERETVPTHRPHRGPWSALWKRKHALAGIALLCFIAPYPFFPFIVNLLAEHLFVAPVVLLLSISCMELIPHLCALLSDRKTGFFVGCAGTLLGGLLANAFAAHEFPTDVQAWFDGTHIQPSLLVWLFWYGILLGLSASVAGKTSALSLNVRGSVGLLGALSLYLAGVFVFSQIGPSFSVISPLLVISQQTQPPQQAAILFAVLSAPACVLLLVLPRLSASARRLWNWIRTRKRKSSLLLALLVVVFVLPAGWEARQMQTVSTVLQDQALPMALSLTCMSCAYPSFQVFLENIESKPEESLWSITLVNPGTSVCAAISVRPQDLPLTNAFGQVYQPVLPTNLGNQKPLDIGPGGTQSVSLLYHLVPASGQHLTFAIHLQITSCTGPGGSGDELQGSQALLFQ